jgi:hypothetical protein
MLLCTASAIYRFALAGPCERPVTPFKIYRFARSVERARNDESMLPFTGQPDPVCDRSIGFELVGEAGF